MSVVFEFPAIVADGRLPRPVAEKIAAVIRSLDGKRVLVTVKEQKRKRSLNQNSFYHGPFIEGFHRCLLDCGQRVSHDDIHAGLRDAYAKNSFLVALPDGQPFRIPPSTARLSTMDFEAYLEEIRAYFATEYSWKLPYPNEEIYNQGATT